jgi:hypothetical protein
MNTFAHTPHHQTQFETYLRVANSFNPALRIMLYKECS